MPSAPGPQPGFQMVLGAGPGACGKQRGPALAVPTDAAFSLQKHWPPGTQCVTKHDHTKPKPRELAFRKGDMVTIIEAVEVRPVSAHVHAALRGHGQSGTLVPSAQLPEPVPPFPEGSSLPRGIPPSFPCSETLSSPGQRLVPCQAQRDGAGGAAGSQRTAGAWGHPRRPQTQPDAVSTAGVTGGPGGPS